MPRLPKLELSSGPATTVRGRLRPSFLNPTHALRLVRPLPAEPPSSLPQHLTSDQDKCQCQLIERRHPGRHGDSDATLKTLSRACSPLANLPVNHHLLLPAAAPGGKGGASLCESMLPPRAAPPRASTVTCINLKLIRLMPVSFTVPHSTRRKISSSSSLPLPPRAPG